MTLPISTQAVSDAREHATQSWYRFMDTRGLKARIPDWRTRTTPDGAPCLSVEVAGPGAAHALRLFASDYYLTLPHPGDLRPQFDIDVPDRTVLVWRRDGVWVELWHPNSIPTGPEPSQAARAASQPASGSSVRDILRGLGDRLPTTRRKKETSRA